MMKLTLCQALVEYHQPSSTPANTLTRTLVVKVCHSARLDPWHLFQVRPANFTAHAQAYKRVVAMVMFVGRLTQASDLKAPSRNTVMGATLSCRAEWTSASDKGGKLDFSKSNETLLLEILKYVEDLCREHAREADVVFKRPFVWKTSLSLSDFEPLRRGDEYTFRFVSVMWFYVGCALYGNTNFLQWFEHCIGC